MDRTGGGPATVPLSATRVGDGHRVVGTQATPVGRLVGRCRFPPPGTTLSCAVSGGTDSLALLVLAVSAGCQVTAIHVNHGLRPGSGHEAAVVATAAGRLGARFRAEHALVLPGPNLEARARAARFAVLPADVATGHTMDDQAETVLCNLLRGTGPGGLAGMRRGPLHPLLGIRRHEAKELVELAGLEWVTDPSNDDRRHVRNRVRHEVLPLLAEISGRDPVPLLARLADIVAGDTDLLDVLADEAVPDATAAWALVGVSHPLAARAVRRWLRDSGATPPSGGRRSPDSGAANHPPTHAEVERVLEVARGGATGTEVGGGWRVRRSKGRLAIEPPAGGSAGGGDVAAN